MPSRDALYEYIESQDGLFTTQQAAKAGYSLPLLSHHTRTGLFARERRGVYRLVHFPRSENEHLTSIWLWSEQKGVFSHETALALFELSDVMPAKIHMTVPEAWHRRRLRVPTGVVLHFNDIEETDRDWFGAVPVTCPRRTIKDCTVKNISPDLLEQAISEARERGLIEENV